MKSGNISSTVVQALHHEYLKLYPDDVVKILNNFSSEDILNILQAEPVSVAATTFTLMNPDIAANLIAEMEDNFFKELFTTIDPLNGAMLLARLEKNLLESRLKLLPKDLAKELHEIMSFPADTAGYLMDPRVTTFRSDVTVEEALNRIRNIKERRIVDICIIDENLILVAVIPLQEVAISQPQVKLQELMKGEPICVQAMAPRDEVVQILEEQKLASLPVVDFNKKLLGIIRYDKLINAAKQEISEDLQKMFGAGSDERALSKVRFAIQKRLPWLEINLATAFLAAAVVGIFEDTIARITALAIFLPVVAGQSGNTGSQALVVTMRGLALREVRMRHWLKISRKELLVGFINGCVVALSTSLIAFLWMKSQGLAFIIGIAMVFSMTIASLAGAVIPIILKAVGQDPAQSSSIILTTVTDVVGFLSFLGLASLLAGTLNIG